MKDLELIGQEKISETVRISLAAAIKNKVTFPHSIMTGPPGYGKTTLAHLIADKIGGTLKEINGATIKSKFELICTLHCIEPGDILFIDEIHSMDKKSHESLYTAIEGNYVNFSMPGDGNEIEKIDIPKFTLLGATTCTVPKPLLDRFTHNLQFSPYTDSDLEKIILLNEKGIPAEHLVKYCRGNPRIAKKRIRWLRDFCDAKGITNISESTIKQAMAQIDISEDGLTLDDIQYINFLKKHKTRAGINAIMNGTGFSKKKITEEIEPFLLMKNYITLSSGGRVLCKLPKK